MIASGTLPRPVAMAIIAVLLVCAAAALLTAQQAASMAGMGDMATLGAGLFLVTWVLTMVAMMFPTIAPMVLTHAGIVRTHGEGTAPTLAFVLGYMAVWTAVGLVLLGVVRLLGSSFAAPIDDWLLRLGGAVVVLAGLYQLTPIKDACLTACRSPHKFIASHDFGVGIFGAARAGLSYGRECFGCCWAFMAVLAVVGLMNLAWMGVFAIVFFLERNWRHGVVLSRISGVVSLVLGAAAIIRPEVLRLLGGPMA